jgi:hypothetical protein
LAFAELSFVLCRAYAAKIKRPYEVRYEPLTQSIQVLDNQATLKDMGRCLKAEVNLLHNALDRLQLATFD